MLPMAQEFRRRSDLVRRSLTDVLETQTTGYHESHCKAKISAEVNDDIIAGNVVPLC